MSVIPMSQLSLMRKRRELAELMKAGEIAKIIEVESDLFDEIDTAVQDSERSPRALLNELGQVIKLYKDLSNLCCLYGKEENHQPQG